jgi:hypothetical protein
MYSRRSNSVTAYIWVNRYESQIYAPSLLSREAMRSSMRVSIQSNDAFSPNRTGNNTISLLLLLGVVICEVECSVQRFLRGMCDMCL